MEHDSPEEMFGKACVQAADIGAFIPRGHPHWRACSWGGNLKTSPPLPHPFGAFFAKAAAYPSLWMVGLSWPLLALKGTSDNELATKLKESVRNYGSKSLLNSRTIRSLPQHTMREAKLQAVLRFKA